MHVNIEWFDGKYPQFNVALSDDIPCSKCGSALDTGLECTECGHDMQPEIYPAKAAAQEKQI